MNARHVRHANNFTVGCALAVGSFSSLPPPPPTPFVDPAIPRRLCNRLVRHHHRRRPLSTATSQVTGALNTANECRYHPHTAAGLVDGNHPTTQAPWHQVSATSHPQHRSPPPTPFVGLGSCASAPQNTPPSFPSLLEAPTPIRDESGPGKWCCATSLPTADHQPAEHGSRIPPRPIPPADTAHHPPRPHSRTRAIAAHRRRLGAQKHPTAPPPISSTPPPTRIARKRAESHPTTQSAPTSPKSPTQKTTQPTQSPRPPEPDATEHPSQRPRICHTTRASVRRRHSQAAGVGCQGATCQQAPARWHQRTDRQRRRRPWSRGAASQRSPEQASEEPAKTRPREADGQRRRRGGRRGRAAGQQGLCVWHAGWGYGQAGSREGPPWTVSRLHYHFFLGRHFLYLANLFFL